MSRCGHCGNLLTTTPNTKKYVRKDGTEVVKTSVKYRCSGKALQKVKCDGKTTHSNIRLEGVVLDELYRYLDQLETVDLSNQINELTKKNSGKEEKELRKLKRDLDSEQRKLTKFKAEILKSIEGSSHFSSEDLSELLAATRQNVSDIQGLITKTEGELESKKVELAEMEVLQEYVPVWREVFEQASAAKKKMMLSTIINDILVHRNRIEIDFKLRINQFIGKMGIVSLDKLEKERFLSHRVHASDG